MLARRGRLAFRGERPQRPGHVGPRVRGGDHAVDGAAVGRDVGVGQGVLVLLLELEAPGRELVALEARARFIAEYEDTLANPYIAAERGYIDTVITPSNTRMNVTKALRALRTKRETLPPKKHGNIPL